MQTEYCSQQVKFYKNFESIIQTNLVSSVHWMIIDIINHRFHRNNFLCRGYVCSLVCLHESKNPIKYFQIWKLSELNVE